MANIFRSSKWGLIRKQLIQKQWIAWAALVVIVTGCGNKPAPPPPPEQKQSGSVDSLLGANTPAPPPPPSAAPPAPAPGTAPANAAPLEPALSADATTRMVGAFNQSLFSKIRTSDYVPSNIVDLKRIIAAGGLPKLPVAPVGKELYYLPNTNDPALTHIEIR
jgi:hypothetical protein